MEERCFEIVSSSEITDSVKPKITKKLEQYFTDSKKYGENAFERDDNDLIPVDIYYGLKWKKRKLVCIKLVGRSQANRDRLEYILKKLGSSIKIDNDITLKQADVKKSGFEHLKIEKGGQKWNVIEHNGPYFSHIEIPYEPHGAKIKYNGKKYPLNDVEERMITFYAARLLTEETSKKKFTGNPTFNQNFLATLKPFLRNEYRDLFTDFSRFDFTDIVEKLRARKEEKKGYKKTAKEKKDERIKKLERMLNYGIAYVDGRKTLVRNPAVEVPGIYVGQGNVMTNKGKVKKFVNPEDVTINTDSTQYLPSPPPGRTWKGVETQKTATWIAKYLDSLGTLKYVRLIDNIDPIKFENARKLNRYIHVVDQKIESLIASNNITDQQMGTVLYLIKNYGIRAGSNKPEEEDADEKGEQTVGATTLKCQNIIFTGDNTKVQLNFFGKDSVLFNNTLDVDPRISANLKRFVSGKSETDRVFDLLSAESVNAFLKSIDKNFTCKVFRTRLASITMYNELKKCKIVNDKEIDEDEDQEDEDEDEEDDKEDEDEDEDSAQDLSSEQELELFLCFAEANRRVALKLNHKKGLTDAAKRSLENAEEKLRQLKREIKAEKDKKKRDKLQEKLDRDTTKLDERKKNSEIALDTSKKNYIDPRIIKSWCLSVGLPVSKVYNNKFQEHFAWALQDPAYNSSWDYIKTPIDTDLVSGELEPQDVTQQRDYAKKGGEKGGEKVTKKRPTKVEKRKPPAKIITEKQPELEELDISTIDRFCSAPTRVNFKNMPNLYKVLLVKISNACIKMKIGNLEMCQRIIKYDELLR